MKHHLNMGSSHKPKIDQAPSPPLIQYLPIEDYIPNYGDFIIWVGWLTTWHGVVVDYDRNIDNISVIFSGVPFILFTMMDEEQVKETKIINLSKIKSALKGTWAIQHHDTQKNTNIWYI